jgi:hypothetical protein
MEMSAEEYQTGRSIFLWDEIVDPSINYPAGKGKIYLEPEGRAWNVD